MDRDEILKQDWAYGVDPTCGFHVLKDSWNQSAYMKQQCDALREHLSSAIESTQSQVPSRSREQGFQILASEGRLASALIDPSSERGVESRIYARWQFSGTSAVKGIWRGIVAYQIPLFDNLYRNGWGHVDLLGLNEEMQPLVIELKLAKEQPEPPHRAIFEATANAIAIQKSWRNLREELKSSMNLEVPHELSTVPIIVLAPTAYWVHWQRSWKRPNFRAGRQALLDLAVALGGCGYPVIWAELQTDASGQLSGVQNATV